MSRSIERCRHVQVRRDDPKRLNRQTLLTPVLLLLVFVSVACAADAEQPTGAVPTTESVEQVENQSTPGSTPVVKTPSTPPTESPSATTSRPASTPTGIGPSGETPANVTPGPLPGPIPGISTVPAFPRLASDTFGDRPLLFTYVPDGSGRVVVVEQDGLVRIFENDPDVAETAIYLDISGRVSRSGNEEGLLGLAFHPEYASNGQVYVYYSAAEPRRSVVSRFTASGDPDSADIESETVLMEIPQPFANHNGGSMAFGPDGYLYIGIGDGGGAGDSNGNGQDPTTLLGTIIRIDVDGTGENLEYKIPPDNPFASPTNGERPEIWAYGLRNPWRFSFDRATGELWAADVGQDAWEEVDVIERGGNYGWNVLEGANCFRPATGCDASGTVLPVAEYGSELGCSITGGYVYRGSALPALQGVYIYGDFCSGRIWGLRTEGVGSDGSDASGNDRSAESNDLSTDDRLTPRSPDELAAIAQLIGKANGQISSFGEDAKGNIYTVTFKNQIHRIVLANQQ